ncbi:DUF1206 domain-containing protein [Pararhizobium mangrovi]|uniref:DUF1206 domain-containing protein n=1 Tax=Pararhizobium mangrovi TaxID=2590452 RepID=A0A506U0N8_9HYPH|nr:DUF1206 domain-containing protein [Pararhizobium mangrovi]TPW27913.1 DUF1206 domain-containing protein [Pararhizobium mangrovi]
MVSSQNAADVARPFARVGYAARGLIYLVIGVFAVLAAFGNGSKKDTHGALQTLLQNTAGSILAWILIVGLFSYALWRVTQSLLDTDDHGTGAKALAIRGGLLASAFTYAALCIYTFSMWYGSTGSSSGSGGSGVSSFFASIVGAQVVAWCLAIVFAGVGIAHFIKAFKSGYAKFFKASPDKMRIIHPLAKTGLIARGIIFWVIALLFVYRGIDGGQGGGRPGMSAALNFIQGLPFGSILLGLMGIGLVAFAVYSFAEAIWRRIRFD